MKFSQWYFFIFFSNISFVKVSLIFLTLQTMFTSLIFPFKVLPIENQEAVKDFLRFRLHIIWLLRQSWNVEGQICILSLHTNTKANEWFPKYEWQGKKFQKKKVFLHKNLVHHKRICVYEHNFWLLCLNVNAIKWMAIITFGESAL